VSSPEVIVIGAGIVGCSVAYELANAGCRVRILDARQPGQGATRASAGVLAPYIEGHEDSPLRSLGRRSLDLYDQFVARVRADSGQDVVYRRNGTFEVGFTGDEVEHLTRTSSSLYRDGVEAHWIQPAQFTDHEPLISPAALGALLIPIHGFVGVASLTEALQTAAEKNGARFKSETGAIRIHSMPTGRVGVTTGTSEWNADKVVLAAGSWSSQITVDGADAVPVKPIRGQLLQVQHEPGALRHSIWGSAGYLVPWPDGSVLVGATAEDVGFDERSTEEGVNKLKAAAATLVPALANAPITSIRVGLRPKGVDDLPMIGMSDAVPGLIYSTAHYRNGVLLAPLTAQLVKELVFDRASDEALVALAPSRHGRF
jgi:glycine oxidase